jgi:ferredoxin-NADP reductase
MSLRPYKVLRKVDETPNAISIFLKAEDEAPLKTFRAGQYLSFDIPRIGRRDYVISTFSPKPSIYRITIVHNGEPRQGSAIRYWIEDVAESDIVRAADPGGAFHLPPALERPIVIMSKDIGEAAVAAIAEELAVIAPEHRAVFLHSTFNGSSFALKAKLASLKADLPNASWKIWFSNPGKIDRAGKEFDLPGSLDLTQHADLLPQEPFDAYICGPGDFVGATETSLHNVNTHCRQVFKESMGAAIAAPAESIPEDELPPLEPRTVEFTRSGKKATWTPERGTLLEFAESLGIQARHSCRTGMCGTCAQRLLSGELIKIRETSAKKGEGFELLCSNVPASDIKLDM